MPDYQHTAVVMDLGRKIGHFEGIQKRNYGDVEARVFDLNFKILCLQLPHLAPFLRRLSHFVLASILKSDASVTCLENGPFKIVPHLGYPPYDEAALLGENWSCGCCTVGDTRRSVTFRPRLANCSALVNPTTPAPTTMTSAQSEEAYSVCMKPP